MSNTVIYSDKRSNFVICCYKKEIPKIKIYYQKVTIDSVDLNFIFFLISIYSDQDFKYVA